ncbi:hypothetical protein EON77_12155, partial [bacterium]
SASCPAITRAGNPARVIAGQLAESPRTDLLVLGSHRERTARDLFEGTIAEKVLTARACPVLVVRQRPAGAYRRVLLALDASTPSANAVRAAERLLLPVDARATIVHVGEPPYEGVMSYADVGHEPIAAHVRHWRAEVRRELAALLEKETAHPERFDLRVEHGHTVRGIVDVVESHAPDLLVLGTRGGGRLHRALLGSVANSVVRQVATDVMIVPAPSRTTTSWIRSPVGTTQVVAPPANG